MSGNRSAYNFESFRRKSLRLMTKNFSCQDGRRTQPVCFASCSECVKFRVPGATNFKTFQGVCDATPFAPAESDREQGPRIVFRALAAWALLTTNFVLLLI